MGHHCRICARERPNEQFSGKGHRTHVCKQCARMSKEKRQKIEAEAEIFGFIGQTHISARNLSRLQALAASPLPEISALARPVLEVVTAIPRKKTKKGQRTIVLGMSMRNEIFSRWHKAGVVEETDSGAEQAADPADLADSEWILDDPF